MRIDLIAPPFAGHLHPILAIGRRLSDAHDVRVISTPSVQRRIVGAGLAAVSVLTDAHDRALHAIASPPSVVGSNPWRLQRQFASTLSLLVDFRDALSALYRNERPSLLIADRVLTPAGHVAEGYGIAWWTSMPSPSVIETPDGPPPYLGGLSPTTPEAVQALARGTTRIFKRSVHALHRKQLSALGVPRLYRADGSEAAYSPSCILALALPALEFARTWPAQVRFVGPQLYAPPTGRPGPTIEAGRCHVLVTCGTHLLGHKDKLASAARAAAAVLPEVVFHVTDGDFDRSHAEIAGAASGNYVRVPYVDYDSMLGRYDLIVHHGGSGVMYHCLRAGKPAVVLPIDYDQFDHAARLACAGIAIRLRALDELAGVVRRALVDGGLATRARDWQARLTAFDPDSRVIGLVDEFADARRELGAQ